MRTGTLLLVVVSLASCQLNAHLDGVGDLPLTGSSGTSGASTSEDAAPTSEPPIATVTGPDEVETTGPALGEVEVVEIVLAEPVHAAGPLLVEVLTKHASDAELWLDGVALDAMKEEETDRFSLTVKIVGATTNATHELEARARNATGMAVKSRAFAVEKPPPGTIAWTQLLADPPGTTNALAITPESDVIEGGWSLVAGAERPSLRKRAGASGVPVWPGETIAPWPGLVGAVEDVAVAPDGTIWAVANVGAPNKLQRPSIARLDPSGELLGAPIDGLDGERVLAVAARPDGGCVAAGATPTGPQIDGKLWYVSASGEPHLAPVWQFGDPADGFDEVFHGVAIVGEQVVVAGAVEGFHDLESSARGAIVKLSLQTGAQIGPAWIAPPDGALTQSRLLAVAAGPDGGWLAVGDACDQLCASTRAETSRFTAAGQRVALLREDEPGSANDVAYDAQGRVLVAMTLEGNGLDARLRARSVALGDLVIDQVLGTPGASDEAALAVARDEYDRVFYAGYATQDGQRRAFVERLHP